MKPRLLDLYCCAGGAARGYQLAGFHVTGVDTEPQPRYVGDEFVQGDAVEYLKEHGHKYQAVHASPPCQRYSALAALPSTRSAGEHPDLVDPTREALIVWGGPWVIENVMSAPLDRRRSIVLCGEMFGLRTIRHRRFEPSRGWPLDAPAHLPHSRPTATSRRRERWAQGWHVSITGDVGTYVGPDAMGVDWMTGNELSQAIPPAYTRFIGEQLIAHLEVTVHA